jgi:hypothetical protein
MGGRGAQIRNDPSRDIDRGANVRSCLGVMRERGAQIVGGEVVFPVRTIERASM